MPTAAMNRHRISRTLPSDEGLKGRHPLRAIDGVGAVNDVLDGHDLRLHGGIGILTHRERFDPTLAE